MTNDDDDFQAACDSEITLLGTDATFLTASRTWMDRAQELKYSYHFRWMGMPIIQYPQDIVAMQEILWSVQPDLLIETGVARGGSLVYYASLFELIGSGEVLGIDIDIRPQSRAALESHSMFHRITLIEGSSIADSVVAQVRSLAEGKRTLVVLDSNHTHDHVLAELEAYADLVAPGSYCVVMDTVVEDLRDSLNADRPWSVGNNPKTAVETFLSRHPEFRPDATIDHKLGVSVAPSGYLRRLA